MTRATWLLLGAALAAPGCFGFDKLPTGPTTGPSAAVPPPPLPVTVDDVRDDAPQLAVEALTKELDRAAAGGP